MVFVVGHQLEWFVNDKHKGNEVYPRNFLRVLLNLKTASHRPQYESILNVGLTGEHNGQYTAKLSQLEVAEKTRPDQLCTEPAQHHRQGHIF